MTRDQAIKKLKKALGPKAYWRVGERISRPDEREAARARAKELLPEKESLRVAMSKRATEMCRADAEYQRLKAAYEAATTELKRIQPIGWYYRFEAGTSDPLPGLGNIIHQKAHGDTWEEVFAELDNKKAVNS